jgi:hypothetical protein
LLRTTLLSISSLLILLGLGCQNDLSDTTGEKMPVTCEINDANAPQWALLQRQTMCQNQDAIHVLVKEIAEADNNSDYLENNVSNLRSWLPAIVGTDDSITREGYIAMADKIWYSGKLFRAYAKEMGPVETTSELIRDSHTAIQFFEYGEPRFVERAMASTRNFKNLWTGKTSKGHLHFKSSHFSAKEISDDPNHAVDVPLNSRAALAGLWTAWYNDNPEIKDAYTQWGKAWVAAANRTDNDKPKGLLPVSISFANETITHISNEEELTASTEMYSFLLGLAEITQDNIYLQPIKQIFDLAISTADATDEEKQQAGSAAWAGAFFRGENVKSLKGIRLLGRARTIGGLTEYDEFLAQYGDAYTQYQINGDLNAFETNLAEELKGNMSEEVLMAMYTGYVGKGLESPFPYITWENTGLETSILVNYAQRDSMNISLYNFGGEKEIIMNPWRLDLGTYKVIIKNKDNFTVGDFDLVVAERGQAATLTLPKTGEYRVSVAQTNSAGADLMAPDLAIGIGDVGVTPKPISGSDSVDLNVIVHNIGNEAARNIEVKAWVDGKPLGSIMIPKIEAPNDLKAKTQRVRMSWRHEKGAHDFLVVISCDQKEITLRNNEFTMHMEEIVMHGK